MKRVNGDDVDVLGEMLLEGSSLWSFDGGLTRDDGIELGG